jgi:hypothetical protein
LTDDPAVPSSFRDPAGFVFERDGILYRQVNAVHREHFDHLMHSGLYEKLVASGLLVSHEEAGDAVTADAYTVIRPERVGFVSYPYEWCFGEVKDAALATLEIQMAALAHGMSLRDASAYNIQFRGGKPVLIDTLSFERLREGEPWVAYRQFCQHFLAPLALMAYLDVRLGRLLRDHVDGIPLDLAASLLPRRARLRLSLFLHLFSHARSQRRHAADTAPPRTGRRFTLQAFRGLIESLETAVRRLGWSPRRTAWSGYYAEDLGYADESFEHKKELVRKFVEEVAPQSVWDLGGNVGVFARIAAAQRIPTVCFDVDPSCVEANYRQVVADGEANILPLVLDLTNPTPATGWANRERLSLVERGPADMALALALVHHLAIGNNVPLPMAAAFLSDLCRWLLVEFVPKEDPRVRRLLAAREDIFPDYTTTGFERAFGERFRIERREEIRESPRTLYLMRRR